MLRKGVRCVGRYWFEAWLRSARCRRRFSCMIGYDGAPGLYNRRRLRSDVAYGNSE